MTPTSWLRNGPALPMAMNTVTRLALSASLLFWFILFWSLTPDSLIAQELRYADPDGAAPVWVVKKTEDFVIDGEGSAEDWSRVGISWSGQKAKVVRVWIPISHHPVRPLPVGAPRSLSPTIYWHLWRIGSPQAERRGGPISTGSITTRVRYTGVGSPIEPTFTTLIDSERCFSTECANRNSSCDDPRLLYISATR